MCDYFQQRNLYSKILTYYWNCFCFHSAWKDLAARGPYTSLDLKCNFDQLENSPIVYSFHARARSLQGLRNSIRSADFYRFLRPTFPLHCIYIHISARAFQKRNGFFKIESTFTPRLHEDYRISNTQKEGRRRGCERLTVLVLIGWRDPAVVARRVWHAFRQCDIVAAATCGRSFLEATVSSVQERLSFCCLRPWAGFLVGQQ